MSTTGTLNWLRTFGDRIITSSDEPLREVISAQA
jgi:hypothetical protein